MIKLRYSIDLRDRKYVKGHVFLSLKILVKI